MAKPKLEKETRRSLVAARKLIESVARADGNEAETRRRVERIFESLMGYDVFEHITREHAVKGAGETEHCDFAIHVDAGEDAKPVIMVELKRVNMDLARKHLKQVASYAINAGCEWILLTNGKEWKLYHVSYGQPPETKLLDSWDLLDDELPDLAAKFEMIGYRSVRKGKLDKLWEKSNVLTHRNILQALVSADSIKLIRRQLKKSTGVQVAPDEIVTAIRKLLNEAAMIEMASVKFTIPEPKRRKPKPTPKPAEQPPTQEAPEPPIAGDPESDIEPEERETPSPM